MSSFLEGSLSATLFDAMKDSVAYELTLISVTKVPDGSGGSTRSEASNTAKGFLAEYSDFYRVAGQIPLGDRRIYIFKLSIDGITPKINDKVTVRGQTYTVVKVSDADPADTLWDLQARPL